MNASVSREKYTPRRRNTRKPTTRPNAAENSTAKPSGSHRLLLNQCICDSARGICSQSEEHAVTEGQQAGVAEQKVIAQANQRKDRDLGGDTPGEAGAGDDMRQRQQRHRGDEKRMSEKVAWRHSNFSNFSPINPRGRNSRISTISRYIEASAAGG